MRPSLALKLIHAPDKLVGVSLRSDTLLAAESINRELPANPGRTSFGWATGNSNPEDDSPQKRPIKWA